MDLSPTPERLKKAEAYESPIVDEKNRRQAYRVLSAAETLHKRGEIDTEQLQAAKKLEKHVLGSQRHDVRVTEEFTEPNKSEDGIEYSATYHGQMLKKARFSPERQWQSVQDFVIEVATLEAIGNRIRTVKCRKMARAQGLTEISVALDRLAYHWGFKTAEA